MNDDTLRDAESYLTYEADLLDSGAYEEWLSLFTDDATYWVPAQIDQADPHSAVSLMYDDRRLLETRVRRLTTAAAHATTPKAAATRQVTNVTILGEEEGALILRSKFTMVEYRRNAQRLFAGTYFHLLRPDDDDGFKIASKRVNLVNCEAELEGLVLPF